MKETYRANFEAKGFDGAAPSSILFFPAGKSSISASKGGKPAQIEVTVSKETADLLQSELAAALLAANEGIASRPFVDFAHEGKTAAALPTSFRWEEGKGVMLDLEWTASGKAAVEGKDFSYFSPEWFQKDGKVTGLNIPGTVGGLVNTPAFQNIGKIAASLTSMDYYKTEILSVLIDLGLITQEQVETMAADDAVKMVRKMADENKTMRASLAESEKVTAARVQADSDLVTAQASIVSLTKQIEADKEAHTAALKAVENSVNTKVAEIVKAAGVKFPVKAETVNASPAASGQVTHAEFKAMTPAEKTSFSASGGKIV